MKKMSNDFYYFSTKLRKKVIVGWFCRLRSMFGKNEHFFRLIYIIGDMTKMHV